MGRGHDETASRGNKLKTTQRTGNEVSETEPKTEAGTTATFFLQAECETITTVSM